MLRCDDDRRKDIAPESISLLMVTGGRPFGCAIAIRPNRQEIMDHEAAAFAAKLCGEEPDAQLRVDIKTSRIVYFNLSGPSSD